MIDGDKFSPHGTWLLVEEEKRLEETKGGIVLPEMQLMAERVMVASGRLLKIGSDREAVLDATGGVMLEPGMRIFFRAFLKDAFHEFIPSDTGLRRFLLKAADVLGIIDDETTLVGEYT